MKLALIGILVNLVLAAVKLVTGWFGNSYALIADGFESTLDIAASFVIWAGLRVAKRPADETHPYGHGKAEPVSAIIVAMVVFGAAVGLTLQSIREIMTPHHAPQPFTLAVLVVVMVIKETLYRIVKRAGDDGQSTALQADAGHHRTDALTSLAAFIGISIALIGGKGYERADDYAAMFACAVIAYNGIRLFLPALYEILDTAPPPEVVEMVRSSAASILGVTEIDKCKVRKMGVEFYADLHVGVSGDISVREGHNIAHRVKNAIRKGNPAISDVLVHVEPAGEPFQEEE